MIRYRGKGIYKLGREKGRIEGFQACLLHAVG